MLGNTRGIRISDSSKCGHRTFLFSILDVTFADGFPSRWICHFSGKNCDRHVRVNVCSKGGEYAAHQYGKGSGQIWLSNVQCTGSETSIADCGHRRWADNNCRHSEDVSVLCYDGKCDVVTVCDSACSVNGHRLKSMGDGKLWPSHRIETP